jgi:hypothetical protein
MLTRIRLARIAALCVGMSALAAAGCSHRGERFCDYDAVRAVDCGGRYERRDYERHSARARHDRHRHTSRHRDCDD